MNRIRPTVGIKSDDKYVEAKNNMIEFIKSLNELTDKQREQLAREFLESSGMAVLFEQFVSYMKNGGIK